MLYPAYSPSYTLGHAVSLKLGLCLWYLTTGMASAEHARSDNNASALDATPAKELIRYLSR